MVHGRCLKRLIKASPFILSAIDPATSLSSLERQGRGLLATSLSASAATAPPPCPDFATLHAFTTRGDALSLAVPPCANRLSPILPPVNTPPSHLQYWREVPQDYELVFMGKHCHGVPHMHTS